MAFGHLEAVVTSQSNFVRAPRAATWLVDLFAPAEQAESIVGDLLEEFSELASRSSHGSARRRYWRQAIKTIASLLANGFRVAPWSTVAAVVGGFLLMRVGSRLPEMGITEVLGRYSVYEHHFGAYIFWITDGIDIGILVVAALIGGIVAAAAKGREMCATMALSIFLCALGIAGYLVMATRTGGAWRLWRLALPFADSFAIVVGGAIVRRVRTLDRQRTLRA
jgi:hypothetical protein